MQTIGSSPMEPITAEAQLFGDRRHARHAAMAPFPAQPSQEPPLEQFGIEPVGFRPAMFARHRDARGMDRVRLDATHRKPARQPEAVAAGFEGKCNPSATGVPHHSSAAL